MHQTENPNLMESTSLGEFYAESGRIKAHLNLRQELCKGSTIMVTTYKADFRFETTRWQGDINYPCVELHETVTTPADVFCEVRSIADKIEPFLAPKSGHYDLREKNVLRCVFSLEEQAKPILEKYKNRKE